jgi:uncharacterized protein
MGKKFMETTNRIQPVTKSERIEVIDILRGLAIFGILMVNIEMFSHAYMPNETLRMSLKNLFLDTFFVDKFYTLFSFLFGLGFSIQLARAETKGLSFVGLYSRRLGWLLLFGFIHACFLTPVDILMVYAVTGFVLLFVFRKARPKILVIVAVALLLVYILGSGILTITEFDAAPATAAELAAEHAEYEHEIKVLGTGTFFEVAAFLFQGYFSDVVNNPILILMLPFRAIIEGENVLIMFLLGLAAGKAGLFRQINTRLPFWRRLAYRALPVGLLMSLVFSGLNFVFARQWIASPWAEVLKNSLQILSAPLVSMGYIAVIVLLSRRVAWLNVFAPVGRMALTNYLTQSLALSLFFFGYGLGLFNHVSIPVRYFLVIVIYVAQVFISAYWLKVFRFGPFEWAWRSLTYLKRQPFLTKNTLTPPEYNVVAQ